MKKLLSLVLCLIMVCSTLCAALPVSAETTDYNLVTSALAGGTYEDYYSASLTATVAGEAAGVTLPGVPVGDAYAILMLPTAYGADSAELSANGTVTAVQATRKFVAVNIGAGDTVNLEITTATDAGVYIFGTCAENRVEEMLTEANGTLNGYTEEYLNLNTYDVEKYTKPIWDEDIVFNESFFPLQNEDGSMSPINLAYDVDRVVSVRNATLDTEYVYGKDYTIENGSIFIPEGSAITTVPYTTVYRDSKANTSFRETLDGTYAFCGQQNLYFTGYYNVTYTTKDTWDGPIPESKGFLLPNLTEKLNTPGSTVKVLCIGDSLGGGSNCSEEIGIPPFAQGFVDMFPAAMRLKYPDVTVENTTIAQGGADASLCVEKLDEIIAYGPDLFVIEFGTNDCMNGDDPYADGKFLDILISSIATVKEALPNCDVIVTSPLITNPIFFPEDWFYRFADAVYTLEEMGVATTNLVAPYQYLLTEKRYIDMSGDFLCHPSDYGMRIMAQYLMKTIDNTEGEQEYIAGLAESITYYRYANEFYDEQWNEITSLMADAKAEISACATADAALDAYMKHTAIIDAVPTIKDIIASSTIDCSKLIFNTSKMTDLIGTTSNLAIKYDDAKKAFVYTLSGRNGSAVLDLSKGDTTVKAEDYKYVVVTMKNPTTNGTRATKAKINFKANGATLSAITYDTPKNDSYVSYIIDMSAASGWTGTVTEIILYPLSVYTNGDVVEMHSIMFATDAANAKDIAIERERAANGLQDSVITNVITNEEDAARLTTATGESYIVGDASGDGILNAKDVLFIKRHILEMEADINITYADTDGDGVVTPADALTVTKTLAAVIPPVYADSGDAKITYSAEQNAARLDIKKEGAEFTYDLSAEGLSADTFKYVSLCAKTADGTAAKVNVTLTTDAGTFTGTLDIVENTQFNANTAAITDAAGTITSVTFTFDIAAGETVYFDSFVLTPTMTTARNAETVRVGAANLGLGE